MPRITPNLWFDTQGLEAAEYYVSIFPNSKVTVVTHYGEDAPRPGDVLTVNFELDGQEYTGINGGPQFTFDEAISLLVNCEDQAEVDKYVTCLLTMEPDQALSAALRRRLFGDAIYEPDLDHDEHARYRAANDNAAVTQYPDWSPFGINGGYYYAKVTYTF